MTRPAAGNRGKLTPQPRRAQLWIGRARSHAVLTSGAGLILAAAATNLTGFLFWLLAARLASVDSVGVAAAAATSTGLAAILAGAGIAPWLLAVLPTRHRPGALVAYASLGAASVAFTLGLVVTGISYGGLAGIADNATLRLLIAATSAATAAAATLDALFITARRTRWVIARTLTVAVLKLALLAAAWAYTGTIDNPTVIVAVWCVATFTGLALAAAASPAAARHLTRLQTPTSDQDSERHPREEHDTPTGNEPDRRNGTDRRWRELALSHLATIANQVPNLALPLLVTAALGAAATGSFYVAWNIAGALFVISPLFVNAYIAEGSRHGANQARLRRHAVFYSYLLLVPAAALIAGLGGSILAWFGDDYRAASGVVALLAGAALFDVIINTTVGTARIRRHLGTVAAINGSVGLGTFALAWLWVDNGITAVAAAVLTTRVAGAAVIAATAAWQRHRLRTTPGGNLPAGSPGC